MANTIERVALIALTAGLGWEVFVHQPEQDRATRFEIQKVDTKAKDAAQAAARASELATDANNTSTKTAKQLAQVSHDVDLANYRDCVNEDMVRQLIGYQLQSLTDCRTEGEMWMQHKLLDDKNFTTEEEPDDSGPDS